MIVGIGVLGIFISTTLGAAALVESRLRMKSDSAVEDRSPNLEDLKSDTSVGHTTSFNAEAKNFIKYKVDEIEKMNEQEINMLIDMIVEVVYCCRSSSVAGIALVLEAEASVVVEFIIEGGISSVVAVDSGGNTIPASHSHNIIVAGVFGSSLCVPTTIIPLNGARLPVALLSNTAITIPLPCKVVGSYRIIS